jgi:DNA-binding NtrC family response regulator
MAQSLNRVVPRGKEEEAKSFRAIVFSPETKSGEEIVLSAQNACARFECVLASSLEDVIRELNEHEFDAVIVDADAVGPEFQNVVRKVHGLTPSLPCVVTTQIGDEETWVEALTAGACDLIEKFSLGRELSRVLTNFKHRAVA